MAPVQLLTGSDGSVTRTVYYIGMGLSG